MEEGWLKQYDYLAERLGELGRWRTHLAELPRVVGEVLPDAEIYVFGSVVRGDYCAESDIDVLVVSELAAKTKRHRAVAEIEAKLSRPELFEIHLAGKELLDWYRSHAGELVRAEEAVSHIRAEIHHSLHPDRPKIRDPMF